MTDPVAVVPAGPWRRLLLRWTLERGLRGAFGEPRHGCRYEPLGWIDIEADELRVRREPLLIPKNPADLDRVYRAEAVRAVNPIERFFPVVGGAQDRRIRHTPHVALLQHYLRTGEKPLDHDYTRMLLARARLQGRPRDAAFLRMKVERLCAVADSIRDRGYMAGRYRRSPISVFERPIHPALGDYVPKNWEIFDGHHRAAAVVALGKRRARVLVIRSIRVSDFDWAEELPWDEARWPAGPIVEETGA